MGKILYFNHEARQLVLDDLLARHRMADPTERKADVLRLGWFPPARWLSEYRPSWLSGDIVAGITLAAYAIPVSLAYAALAGLLSC